MGGVVAAILDGAHTAALTFAHSSVGRNVPRSTWGCTGASMISPTMVPWAKVVTLIVNARNGFIISTPKPLTSSGAYGMH